jgi:uncharacterized protein (TIGR00730 family)
MKVAVFCGARAGADERYVESAFAMGQALAERHWQLVYGGARTGLMGALADGALQSHGHVVGVIPSTLLTQEFPHPNLSERIETPDLASRKSAMIELCDAFLVLPGGVGTFDELFEVLCLMQVGVVSKKRLGVFNVAGFYDGLKIFLETASSQGFIGPETLTRLRFDHSSDVLLNWISSPEA